MVEKSSPLKMGLTNSALYVSLKGGLSAVNKKSQKRRKKKETSRFMAGLSALCNKHKRACTHARMHSRMHLFICGPYLTPGHGQHTSERELETRGAGIKGLQCTS